MTTNSDNDILIVSNVSVKVKDQVILDDISFSLKKGATLAIVGPNGAGKTVLFRALLGLMPYTGKIEWCGAVKIGYVPQKLSVSDIPISVREFMMYKCGSGSDAEKCITSVELGTGRMLDKELGVLSGGQLQRVLIAWAIADNPDVLLFDEPTSAVDVDSQETIYELLSRLQQEHKITILIITHDMHVVRHYSDYMLALNRKAIFFGDSEEITNPSLLEAIYGSRLSLRRKPMRQE
ncbi:MAG: metal ABC transporter ATP-binding protein [Thaumarchaeota archaeon]|nr:metal ABC transporter ATP-binding protein [Nitrososphaerota archaeon]